MDTTDKETILNAAWLDGYESNRKLQIVRFSYEVRKTDGSMLLVLGTHSRVIDGRIVFFESESVIAALDIATISEMTSKTL